MRSDSVLHDGARRGASDGAEVRMMGCRTTTSRRELP